MTCGARNTSTYSKLGGGLPEGREFLYILFILFLWLLEEGLALDTHSLSEGLCHVILTATLWLWWGTCYSDRPHLQQGKGSLGGINTPRQGADGQQSWDTDLDGSLWVILFPINHLPPHVYFLNYVWSSSEALFEKLLMERNSSSKWSSHCDDSLHGGFLTWLVGLAYF